MDHPSSPKPSSLSSEPEMTTNSPFNTSSSSSTPTPPLGSRAVPRDRLHSSSSSSPRHASRLPRYSPTTPRLSPKSSSSASAPPPPPSTTRKQLIQSLRNALDEETKTDKPPSGNKQGSPRNTSNIPPHTNQGDYTAKRPDPVQTTNPPNEPPAEVEAPGTLASSSKRQTPSADSIATTASATQQRLEDQWRQAEADKRQALQRAAEAERLLALELSLTPTPQASPSDMNALFALADSQGEQEALKWAKQQVRMAQKAASLAVDQPSEAIHGGNTSNESNGDKQRSPTGNLMPVDVPCPIPLHLNGYDPQSLAWRRALEIVPREYKDEKTSTTYRVIVPSPLSSLANLAVEVNGAPANGNASHAIGISLVKSSYSMAVAAAVQSLEQQETLILDNGSHGVSHQRKDGGDTRLSENMDESMGATPLVILIWQWLISRSLALIWNIMFVLPIRVAQTSLVVALSVICLQYAYVYLLSESGMGGLGMVTHSPYSFGTGGYY